MNMLKFVLALFTALSIAVPQTALAAQSVTQPTFVIGSPPPITQLSVSATATESANPDMATVGFTIETHDQNSAATATSDNNAIYQRFSSQAIALGLSRQNLRTTFFNVSYVPAAPRGAPIREYGYTVTRTIAAEVHKLDAVGTVIDEAVGSGVNNVNYVTFGISNNRPLLLRALADAVSQARASAQTIAAAAGVRLVRIHTISQGYSTIPTPIPQGTLRTIAGVTTTTILPTSVSVQATVSISYDIR